MINADKTSQPDLQYLGQIVCPECNSETTCETGSPEINLNRSLITIPIACQACGHHWSLEVRVSTSGSLYVRSDPKALLKLPDTDDSAHAIRQAPSNLGYPLERRWGPVKNAKVAVIPLPVFWAMVILLVVLFGVGGWLVAELRQRNLEDTANAEREAVLAMARVTGTAEARITATRQAMEGITAATAEALVNAAATATVVKSETQVASTATAEWRATATTESFVTVSMNATEIAERSATATAERVNAVNVAATATTERIRTATAEKVAAEQSSATAAAERSATVTAEAILTLTPAPAPKLNVRILGCDTGVDVFNLMGEVTNAWVVIENAGDAEATDVKVVLSAGDEVGEHQDKREDIAFLPAGYQILLKLTVDTATGAGSDAQVTVTATQGIEVKDSKSSCRALDENAKKLIAAAGEIGKLVAMEVMPGP